MLSEINIAPRILTNFTGVMPSQFKKDLDSYLKTRSPVTFLSELRSNLQVGAVFNRIVDITLKHTTVQFCVNLYCFVSQVSNEPGNRYNIQLINALVLYVGTQAIAHIHNKGSTPSMSTITHSAHMDIFQNLAVDLDTEGKVAARRPHKCMGNSAFNFCVCLSALNQSRALLPGLCCHVFSGRYLFLNAIANQLRYPNSHTHYFSCTMLYLFAEANTEAIQEQITR